MDFDNVSVHRRAETLHEGRVSRRSVITADGEMKSLGLMLAGTYRLSTQDAETLEITAGRCRVKLAEQQTWSEYGPGERVRVPAHSHFEIEVDELLDFVCHYGD